MRCGASEDGRLEIGDRGRRRFSRAHLRKMLEWLATPWPSWLTRWRRDPGGMALMSRQPGGVANERRRDLYSFLDRLALAHRRLLRADGRGISWHLRFDRKRHHRWCQANARTR